MKTALVLLAFVAYAAAASIDLNDDNSTSAEITDFVLRVQEQMPCGFPRLDLPPLAPIKISHKEVNIDTPVLKLKGSVKDLRLNGLNDYTIEQLTINPLTRKVTFRLALKNVNLDTDYDLDLVLKKAGFTIHLVGKGKARFAVKDIQIWGNAKYILNIFNGKLKLKTLEVRIHIDDVDSNIQGILGDGKINKKMNEILEDAVQIGINSNEDYISGIIEANGLPLINKFLDTVTLKELLEAVGGRATDDEKKACVPPMS